MADWITSNQYLDLVDRACQADKQCVYQLAGIHRSKTSTSTYVYLIRDRRDRRNQRDPEITRLRFSSHSTRFHENAYTINIAEHLQTQTVESLRQATKQQLLTATSAQYANFDHHFQMLVKLVYWSTAQHWQVRVDPVISQIVITSWSMTWVITDQQLVRTARVLADLNLLMIPEFYDQHQLVAQFSILSQILWMYQNPYTLTWQSLHDELLSSCDDIQEYSIADYQRQQSPQQIVQQLTAHLRDDHIDPQTSLADWRRTVIQAAKMMTFPDHYHLLAYDDHPRATAVILYFMNSDRLYRVRIGQKPTDYQRAGLNHRDQYLNNFIQLDSKTSVEQIVDALSQIEFDPRHAMPISYQLLVSLQLLKRAYRNHHYYIHAEIAPSVQQKLAEMKHYGYDPQIKLCDVFIRKCQKSAPCVYLPQTAVVRWFDLLLRCNLASVESRQLHYRLPGLFLLNQYDNIRYFRRATVWNTDIAHLKVKSLIQQLRQYSRKGIKY